MLRPSIPRLLAIAAALVVVAVVATGVAEAAEGANRDEASSPSASSSFSSAQQRACDAAKAEGCALCTHMVDPVEGCGLVTASDVVTAVNSVAEPDVGAYSVWRSDAAAASCTVEVDMPNEGGSAGGCRVVEGMMYAVATCPVGKIPVSVACVAVSEDGTTSTPVAGTAQSVLLHTATCSFPSPFPAPFEKDSAVIFLACQSVSVETAQGKKMTKAPKRALPSMDALMRVAGKGARDKRVRLAAAAAKAKAASG